SAARVVVTSGLVLGGIAAFGLPGALGGAILSEAVCRAVMLARGCRFLGVPIARALDLALLGRVAAAAAGAAVPALGVRFALAPGIGMVLAAGSVYGLSYLALRVALVGKPRTQLAAAVA